MASVLVIEDDQRIRETVARSLADNGHAVRTEGRGTDALGVVVDWRPDVVVLDLGLPDLDGADVLRMVRSVSSVPGDRGHRPRRRCRGRPASRRRGRRLRDQAVLGCAARRPDPCRPAPRRRCGDGGEPRHPRDRRPRGRPRPPHRDARRRGARAVPPRVRPARPPGPPLTGGRHPARAAGRGVAPAPRRGRQDHRRPPVMAAPEAGRVRQRARATCTPCAGWASSWSDRAPDAAPAMRRRLFLVTLAVTTLLVAAFAIPLGAARAGRRPRPSDHRRRGGSGGTGTGPRGGSHARAARRRHRTHAVGPGRPLRGAPPGRHPDRDPTELNDDSVALAREQQLAFSESVEGGIDVYSPVVLGTGDVVVLRVHVPDSLATEGVVTSWLVLALVAAVLLVVAVVATDRLARSVTRPAADLARTSRALAGGDTTRASRRRRPARDRRRGRGPEPPGRPHRRAARGRARAGRRPLPPVPHPLTALRLDAEGHGAADLIEDVDRLEAEVSELIRAARRPLHEEMAVRCDLAEVVEDRAAFWGALADDDGRRWECRIEPAGPHPVRLPREDVAAALDVLLGNVFAHTPDGTPYAVSVRGSAGSRGAWRSRTVVTGSPMRPRCLDRGSSAGGSTGLGLDIASSDRLGSAAVSCASSAAWSRWRPGGPRPAPSRGQPHAQPLTPVCPGH